MAKQLDESIVEANRLSFAEQAARYDQVEVCMRRHARKGLSTDVALIAERIAVPEPTMLDCGAGTGNLGIEFLRRGFRVAGVDVSSPMLERFRAKVSQSGNMRDRLELVEQDIGSFLTHGKDLYDVVGCSSFLHHVPDYLAVVDALGSRVKPGGFLYIAWEPLPTGSRTRPHQFLVRFDLGLDLLLHDPIGFVLAVSRHISRVIRHNVDTPKDQAALVDFHVPTGLDVSALEQTIKGRGFRVWMYSEFAGRRQPVAQILADRVLHVTDHFSLIAERTDERQGEELSGK